MNLKEIIWRVLRAIDNRLIKPEDRMKPTPPASSTIPSSLMPAYTQDGLFQFCTDIWMKQQITRSNFI